MIVVDAGVLSTALVDDGRPGTRMRRALRGQDIAVPHLADVEVASVLRRGCLHGNITESRARQALQDLARLPLDRFPAPPFLARAFELRDNVSAYDAVYVALAEQLDCLLLTADSRLASAPGPLCAITVLA